MGLPHKILLLVPKTYWEAPSQLPTQFPPLLTTWTHNITLLHATADITLQHLIYTNMTVTPNT